MKQFQRTIIILLIVLGMAATQVTPGNAAHTRVAPDFCTSAGPIVATAIPSRVDLRTCPIQGRELVIQLHNGRAEYGLYVPPSGWGTGNAAETTAGEYILSASNYKGYVTINWSIPHASASVRPAIMISATDPACGENAFNLAGPSWMNTGTPTDVWYYNESTASRAGLTVSATEDDIRQAGVNITKGINNCGFAEGVFDVRGSFQGNTSEYANITSTGTCNSKFPNGQNTVSWAAFDSSVSTLLAATCWEWKITVSGSQEMTEADTDLGSNRGIVDAFPANCSNSYDLQSVMTHEWGHAYGLAHETSGPDEVMYPISSPCHLRRHLGGGDWSGMGSLY